MHKTGLLLASDDYVWAGHMYSADTLSCYLITAQLNLLQCFMYTMLYTSDILGKCS